MQHTTHNVKHAKISPAPIVFEDYLFNDIIARASLIQTIQHRLTSKITLINQRLTACVHCILKQKSACRYFRIILENIARGGGSIKQQFHPAVKSMQFLRNNLQNTMQIESTLKLLHLSTSRIPLERIRIVPDELKLTTKGCTRVMYLN